MQTMTLFTSLQNGVSSKELQVSIQDQIKKSLKLSFKSLKLQKQTLRVRQQFTLKPNM